MTKPFVLLSASGIALALGIINILVVTGLKDFALQQGIRAASVTLLGLLVVGLLPRWRYPAAAALLALIIPLATAGFWFSYGQWGISDWDYYFSLHENIRRSIVQYHVFPLWNPYTCGGTAGLADPEFSLFTPTFLLELIFGIPTGFRLAIYLATITGGLGTLILARAMRLPATAGFLAACIFSLSSVNLLEIVEGHPNIFAAGWLPWIFWSWLKAYQAPAKTFLRQSILCGLFLALTFFQGGIYLLMYTSLSFIILPFLVKRPRRAILTTLYAGLWAVGLAAIKLIPVMLWLREFQDSVYASSTYTLPNLHHILLGRYLHGAEVLLNQGSGWHEYGAYIGYGTVVLALLAALTGWKSRLVRGLIVATVLALVISSIGPFLKPVFDHASFLPRSNISRIIILGVLALALLAGHGLHFLIFRRPQRNLLLAPVIIGLIAVELMTLSYQLSTQAFVLPPAAISPDPAPSPIAFTAHRYEVRHNGSDYTRAYAATLAGYGTLSYCSVLSPPIAVRTIHDEEDKEIVSLQKAATYTLDHWSPNEVHVRVTTPVASDVIINTNYARGWQVNNQPAQEIVGRPATRVAPGTHRLIFHYSPPGLLLGILLSSLTIIAAAYFLGRSRLPYRFFASAHDKV
ncbi:MAG: hypothetical protein WEA04_00515 [Candidatus Andersenbacteria bacterium]